MYSIEIGLSRTRLILRCGKDITAELSLVTSQVFSNEVGAALARILNRDPAQHCVPLLPAEESFLHLRGAR